LADVVALLVRNYTNKNLKEIYYQLD